LRKRIIATICALCMVYTMINTAFVAQAVNDNNLIPIEKPLYSDVSNTDWFYTYVSDLSRKNVIGGYSDGTFKPYNTVTCGEGLKLILLAAGYDKQDAADSHWASGYLKLAVAKGLVGADVITDLNAPISRLLIAQISAKALGLSKQDTDSPFADTSDGYTVSLYRHGIMTGSVEGSVCLFKPNDSIIRSEISAVVWRISNANTNPVTNPGSNPGPDPGNQSGNSPGKIPFGNDYLNILQGVPVNSYSAGSFYMVDGLMHYKSDSVKAIAGIDVSAYQGDINWKRVKDSGIQFAMIRIGFRGYGTGSMNLDDCFDKNIRGALDAGLQVGVYFFSQAITVEEAIEEANFVLSHIKGYNITYPVVFDWENINSASARTYNLDSETLCQCANAFCNTVKNAGYDPMIYFNAYLGYIKYDLSKILGYKFWLAQYKDTPDFYYDFQMWQYSSSGKVPGISGSVDMNIYFIG